jgi:RNA 2',3'-cyclic 3'-phosphodiesterase
MKDKNTVRTFIAVDLPPQMLERIEGITTFFKKETPPKALKWVDTENLHLTIKFIGEINEDKVAHVKQILSNTLASQNAFDIEISGLGMYPNKNNPRVIWLGIAGRKPLIQIFNSLDQALTTLDIRPEGRDFAPHLTIARVRRNTDKATVIAIGKTLSQFKVEPLGAVTIDQVHLYQSVLEPSGPIYTTLHSVSLNQV